jgi:hypothetical protein
MHPECAEKADGETDHEPQRVGRPMVAPFSVLPDQPESASERDSNPRSGCQLMKVRLQE